MWFNVRLKLFKIHLTTQISEIIFVNRKGLKGYVGGWCDCAEGFVIWRISDCQLYCYICNNSRIKITGSFVVAEKRLSLRTLFKNRFLGKEGW